MTRAILAVSAFLFCVGPLSADPVGQYTLEGTNPSGGPGYSGTVSVERTGQTFRVTWQIAGQRFVGTGIGDDKFLAVSYRSGQSIGLALYGREGNGPWVGVWTYADGREIGKERWDPR
jgi:hypothetical protein